MYNAYNYTGGTHYVLISDSDPGLGYSAATGLTELLTLVNTTFNLNQINTVLNTVTGSVRFGSEPAYELSVQTAHTGTIEQTGISLPSQRTRTITTR